MRNSFQLFVVVIFWLTSFLGFGQVNMSCNNTLSVCGGTYSDPGGAANYANNVNCTQTVCPTTPGTCVTLQFTGGNLELNWDYLRIYNGPSAASPLLVTLTGNIAAQNVTATAGCLTLVFTSDGSVTSTGWQANIICHPCGSPPPPPPGPVVASDCSGAVNICTNSTFQIDPSGSGLVTEFTSGTISNPSTNPGSTNTGCLLSGELNSTWMIVNVSTTGTLEFSVGTPGGFGCLDWIMWPYTGSTTCTQIINNLLPPVRCNWNANCQNFAGMATPLPAGGLSGDFEPELNVTCGQRYLICLSNYSSQTTSLPLNFFGTATISCTSFTPISVNSPTICQNGTATLTATGGNTYTWSPATGLNTTSGASVVATPATTTTYTVTGVGTCGTGTATSTVTVNPNVTPTFTQVAPVCSGGTITLPTTSTNGITGTWSPAINNTATTTYTFTPTAGLCATTTTMTVTVNQPITPTFTQVSAICSGGTISLPTTSNNAITGTWSPAVNNTATTTYTFTPGVGQCATTAPMTVTVNQPITPTFTQVAPICSGGSIVLNTTSDNSITGTWSPAINNTATTLYTFTPTVGQCATTATMTVSVGAPVTPTFTQVTPICSGGTFTLPTTATNGFTGSWSPAINNTATTTYTFTPTAGQCATTATMSVTVDPNITPTFTQVAPICNGGTFTLPTTANNAITGTWSPAINNAATTTYTFTPTAGLCATTATMTVTVNQPITPTFTQVAPICNGGSFVLNTTSDNAITGTWSPANNNTTTTTYTFTPALGQCATTATMTVTVDQPTTPTFTQVAPICSGGSIVLNTTSDNSITGTWSPAINNTATTLYTFTPTAGQCATTATMTVSVGAPVTPTFTQVTPICSGGAFTLPTTATNGFTGSWSPAINNTATTTYTFTPTAGQCATTATMSVTVDPNITPTFTQVAPICNGGTFTLPTTANNAITGTWSPAINNTATTTYTFTPTAGLCATTATMTVTVNQPTAPAFTQVTGICSGGTFTLPTTSNNAINGSWSPANNNTATTTYTFTPTAGQCAATATMTVTVSSPTTPTFTQVSPICNGGAFTLPTSSNNAINGTWSPAINNTATTLYTFTPTAGQCANTSTMTVTVNSLPVIDMSTVAVSNENCNQSDGSIGGIQVNGGTPNYQYGWNTTPPSTTLSISGLSDGMYQLVVTDANGCLSTTSVQVGSNPAPQIDATGLNVTQPTCVDGGSISGITASGSAPLTYSWTGTSQTGSTLSNLQAGSYALTVTDAAGCTAQYGPIVLVNPVLPQADFTWTPTTPDVNTTVTFTDNSTGNGIVSYQWQIDGQAPSGQQVETAFTAGGTYTIVLTVTDANGCVDDTMQLITVISEIQVPNVITANGDGVNDLFIIDGLTENTTLTILNRWGNVVFTTENYQNNWNGRDSSGQELAEGVYTYIYHTISDDHGHGFIHLVR